MVPGWIPSKRDLGVVYLVGVGFVFTAIVFREAFAVSTPSLEQLLSLAAGFFLAVGLIAVGYWLLQSPLEDDRVLVVSEWGALGMALPTTVIVLGILALPLDPTAGLLVTVIGAGGIVGTLGGAAKALEAEHRRLNEIYRRNKVLQRVLRHNIRNGMTVVQGYADLLEEDLDGTRVDMVKHIRQEAGSIVDLSEMARNLDSLEEEQYTRPIAVGAVIDELLEGLHRNYPAARIESQVEDGIYVRADNFIELALWELLEYSIRNSDHAPVTVAVRETDAETVAITVCDDHSELSSDALRALERGSETQLQHLDGMELWVATWLIENMGGEIDFRPREPAGIEIEITLPAGETTPGRTLGALESNVSPR